MNPQRTRSLLVVGLLLTAGCATSSAPASPPGISGREVTDATSLVQTHTDALEDGTFTVRSTTTMRGVEREFRVTTNRTWRVDPTGPVRGSVVRTTTTEGDAPDRYTRAPDRVETWRNGTTTVQRVRRENGYRYQRIDLFNSSAKLNPALQRKNIYRLTTRSNATVERISRDGSPFYRISAKLNETRVTTNASMTLLVDPDGVVHEIRTAQTVRYRSGPRRITERIRIVAVGTTGVDRPNWVRNATEQYSHR